LSLHKAGSSLDFGMRVSLGGMCFAYGRVGGEIVIRLVGVGWPWPCVQGLYEREGVTGKIAMHGVLHGLVQLIRCATRT